MRFLLGAIFGVLLLVVVVFIADSLATSESAAGAAPRQIVNWALQCHLRFAGRIEAGLKLTAGLLALEPYGVPTPDAAPKTRLPLGHRSAKVARCDNQKPLRPTYPCEDCANLVPYYYCDACRATWDDRQRAERERINAKQRERRARRREMKRPALCATCGAARTPASAFELSRRADGAW